MEDIDFEKLKADLIYLYEHAMKAYPIAITDLLKVESADEKERLRIAKLRNFDLTKYKKEQRVVNESKK